MDSTYHLKSLLFVYYTNSQVTKYQQFINSKRNDDAFLIGKKTRAEVVHSVTDDYRLLKDDINALDVYIKKHPQYDSTQNLKINKKNLNLHNDNIKQINPEISTTSNPENS